MRLKEGWQGWQEKRRMEGERKIGMKISWVKRRRET